MHFHRETSWWLWTALVTVGIPELTAFSKEIHLAPQRATHGSMFPKTTLSRLSTLEKPTALTLVQVHLKLIRRLRKTRSFTLLTIQSLLHYFEFFFFFFFYP